MEHCEALLMYLEVKWSKPSITEILGGSFPLSRNSSEVCVGIPLTTEVILFFSGGLGLEIVVSPYSLLNSEFSSSYLPYALKHSKAKLFQTCPGIEVRGGRVQGTRGSGVRVLVPVITGGYWKKSSLADGSSFPHP